MLNNNMSINHTFDMTMGVIEPNHNAKHSNEQKEANLHKQKQSFVNTDTALKPLFPPKNNAKNRE